MVVIITEEGQSIIATMDAGDKIQIYINDNPISKTLHTVETGNTAIVEFRYKEVAP